MTGPRNAHHAVVPSSIPSDYPHWIGIDDRGGVQVVHYGMHHTGGLFFKREAEGAVRICQHADASPGAALLLEVVIPANEWASLVASVSKGGETAESWRAALDLHEEK